MFGHQDNQSTEQNDQAAPLGMPADGSSTTPNTQGGSGQQDSDSNQGSYVGTASGSKPASDDPILQHPVPSLDDLKDEKDDVISPAGGYPKPLSPKDDTFSRPHISGNDDNQLTDATDEGLVEIKQKALDQLFPLIDKLDQNSEEHFKTLMMIIQASDNHTLIEKAYQVAQTIDDEKSRAQALLDIINEINYFTQQPEI